jgi:hypothetical protein
MLFHPPTPAQGQATHDLTWIVLFCAITFTSMFLLKLAYPRTRRLYSFLRKRLGELRRSPSLKRWSRLVSFHFSRRLRILNR